MSAAACFPAGLYDTGFPALLPCYLSHDFRKSDALILANS
jgi:hypothetical protein